MLLITTQKNQMSGAGPIDFDHQQQLADLRRMEEKLSFYQEFNDLLLESTGDCILLVDADGALRSLNKHGCEELQIAPSSIPLGRHWTVLFPGLETAQCSLKKMVSKSSFQASSKTAGSTRHWSFVFRSLANAAKSPEFFVVIARDITEAVLAEKALRASEEAFRRMFEENPIGIILNTLDLRVTKVNNALQAMLGFSENEIAGLEMPRLVLPSGNRFPRENVDRLVRGEIRAFQSEVVLETRRKQGIWAHLTTSVLRDAEGNPACIFQMVKNIHDRKLSEQQVFEYQRQLQFLASEISLVEERERRRIATNLHDRIGQTLAFARLKLGTLGQAGRGDVVDEVRELIDQAIVDTRSLTFELSPPVLYELGLGAAIEWLSRKIQEEHNIPARFHDDGLPKPLHEDFRIVLFQAVRELCVNIVKHAGASHAQILVRRDSDAIRVIVEDDGAGFDPAKLASRREASRSFGLFNIRERIEFLGGKMKIHSEPGRGTRVTLIAPLKLEPA